MEAPAQTKPSENDIEQLDLFTPTINDLARQNLPLTIPWHPKQTIKPGMLFRSFDANSDNPWSTISPFHPESLMATIVRYSRANGDVASYKSQSTTSRVETSEHLSVSLTVTIDALFASASVGGQYEKTVAKNTDVSGKDLASCRCS